MDESSRKRDIAEPSIELKKIHEPYQMGDELVRTNNGISLTINYGEFVAVVGRSSDGKSILMNIVDALDVPTDGEYILGDEDVSQMSGNQLVEIRDRMAGFIFQQYNLLPRQSLLESVELPLLYVGASAAGHRERTLQFLERMGLKERWRNLPNQLSDGQQQRVSIARALAGSPSLILVDKPTGALDSKTSREVLDFLEQLNNENDAIVMITHNSSIAMEVNRVVQIHGRKISFDGDVEECGTVI